jgi:hypothetical protein
MTWLEVALIAAVIVGIGAGGFLVAQRPTFWFGLGAVMFRAILPHLAKRMSPTKEKELHDCIRRGGEWDHVRKKCRDRK